MLNNVTYMHKQTSMEMLIIVIMCAWDALLYTLLIILTLGFN